MELLQLRQPQPGGATTNPTSNHPLVREALPADFKFNRQGSIRELARKAPVEQLGADAAAQAYEPERSGASGGSRWGV